MQKPRCVITLRNEGLVNEMCLNPFPHNLPFGASGDRATVFLTVTQASQGQGRKRSMNGWRADRKETCHQVQFQEVVINKVLPQVHSFSH